MAERESVDEARHAHAHQWVLIDTRFQLLSIGTALYRGTSPRTALDSTARHVLVPRMRNAVVDGNGRTDTIRYAGRLWTTRVIPVNGPVSQVPLAVLGCYGSNPDAFPPVPMIGSWEWRVTPPGPDQQMRTYWSASLYDVYGIAKPGSDEPTAPAWQWWEGPEWLDELILDSDRAEMRRVLDAFINAETDKLFIHSYRVHSPTTREVHRLRLSGRSYVADHGHDRWFRGVSVRIDDVADEATLTPPSTAAVVDAAFALSADPLCAVDTVYEHIYMTSKNFGELGIDLPAHRHVPEMVHPDDLQKLRTFFKDVTRPTNTVGSVRVRFGAVDNRGWRTVEFTGTGMRLSHGDPHHVLCRVTLIG
jgi:hypothetical protein